MHTESEWRSWMVKNALKKLGDVEDAEDLAQIALLRFWENQGCLPWEYPDPEFAKVVCHRLVDLIVIEFHPRKNRRDPIYSLQDLPEHLFSYDPSTEYLDSAHTSNLMQCLTALLSPAQQKVLTLLVQGYSHGEISQLLGIRIGTVKRHILRIRQKASSLVSTKEASASELISRR